MSLFHRKISFMQPDPLADGLGDDIIAEQREADAFQSLNDTSAEELVSHWNTIVKDIEKDPDWFDFDNE